MSNNRTSIKIENLPSRTSFKRRRKVCPFSGENGLKIDYKNPKMLQKYVSEKGKIVPSRITAVSRKKQRELATMCCAVHVHMACASFLLVRS